MLGNWLSLCPASQGHTQSWLQGEAEDRGNIVSGSVEMSQDAVQVRTGIPMQTGAQAGRKQADASQVLPREAEDGAGVRTQDTLRRLQKPLALRCVQGNRFSVKGTRPNCSLVKRKGG